MIQVSLVLLVLLTSTVLSQQVWYFIKKKVIFKRILIFFCFFKKPKYDAASLEKALYKIGSIQELRQLGINSKFYFCCCDEQTAFHFYI